MKTKRQTMSKSSEEHASMKEDETLERQFGPRIETKHSRRGRGLTFGGICKKRLERIFEKGKRCVKETKRSE